MMRKITSLFFLIILLVISKGAVCHSNPPPTPPVVTSPVAGDVLSADSAHAITWTVTDPPYWWVESYKLLYTLDNGLSWSTIHNWVLGEGNPDKFIWEDIPVVDKPTEARIKLLLLDLFDLETYSALSDYFTIGKPKRPVARFTGPTRFFKDKIVTFDASKSVDYFGSIVKYTFDFGDGTSVEQTTPIFTHTYASYGNFRTSLTVVDNRGLSDSASQEVTVGLVYSKPPLNISKSPNYSYAPLIDIGPAGDINVLWQEDPQIMFSRSIDGGKTFTAPKAVIPYAAGYTDDQIHMIADNNGVLHVVWRVRDEMLNTSNDIFYIRSTNGGKSFSPPLQISALDGIISMTPSIAVDGTSVGIAWHDTDLGFYSSVQFSLSTDGGRSFSAPVSLPYSIVADTPSFVLSSGKIYVVSQGGETLNFSTSSDGGRTFSTKPIYDATLTKGYIDGMPLIRLDSKGNIYLIWNVHTATSDKIRLAISTNQGISFSYPKTIVQNGILTDLFVDNYDRVFCTWYQSNKSWSFVSLSADGGQTFSPGLKLDPPGKLSLGRQNRFGLISGRTIAGGGPPDIFYQGGAFQPIW